jgi:HEPN domain-containing protein
MPASESTLPQDWFVLADLDLQATEILLAEDGPLPIAAFHLQQAAEKYLKGYLLSTGWSLRRIHDLEVLISEAADRDEDFAEFLEPCQRITEYYIESRYPTCLPSVFELDQ